MIHLTIIKNPFNPAQNRECYQVSFMPGKTVEQYVLPYLLGDTEFVYSCNGELVEAAFIPQPGDYIAASPVVGKGGSKNILKSIASIALMAWAGGLSSSWVKAGTMNSFWAGMAAAAITMVGGALINHLFPTPKADRSSSSTSANPEYGFGKLQTISAQGAALAVTYGTMQTAGSILAQHVTTDGSKQYLNLLLCGGQGPIDAVEDIRINDNPISYFSNVQVDIRLGTNDQEIIPNFGDTFADQALSYELQFGDSTWSTQQTEGNGGQGLEVTVEFSNGLYHIKDDGNLEATTVVLEIQYRKVGGAWEPFGNGTYTITENSNGTVTRVYRIDNIEAAQYEVRMRGVSRGGQTTLTSIDTQYSNRVWWVQLSSIIYDDFCRPGKVLIGIKALATSQLNGQPTVTWKNVRNTVNVWNPYTGQYEQKSARNPAWASYDIWHQCRNLKNINTGEYQYCVFGIPAGRLVYQEFSDWAAYCEERNLVFESLYDSASDLWTSLKKAEVVGRGKVIPRGTKYGCVCDAPADPVQMFTVGNIMTDSFQEDFMALKDRANAVEVSFVNKDKGYQKDTVMVYGDDYDESDLLINPTQISLDGCTDLAQAYKQGKYWLRVNSLVRTATWQADIDAIVCRVGDVVLAQHDVPQWGFGGRLLAATETTLKLDRPVALDADVEYAIALQITNPAAVSADDAQKIVFCSVQGVDNGIETDTVTLVEPLAVIPQKYDLYSFGEVNKAIKPFRVINITRAKDFKRKIQALEYNEAIYQEATDVPIINYSSLSNSVNGLNVNDRTDALGCNLDISWRPPRQNYAGALVLVDGVQVEKVDMDKTSVSVVVSVPQTYTVSVIPIDIWGNQGTATTVEFEYPEIAGDPPDNLDYFAVSYLNGKFVFSWKKTGGMPSAVGYEFRKGDTWNSGQFIMRVTGADSDYATFPAMIGTTKFWVCPYNTHGYASEPLGDSITIDNIPTQQVIATYPDYDKACTLTGPGLQKDDYTLQLSTVTYEVLQAKTYSELKTSPLIGAAVGEVVLTGPVIDFGTLAQVQIIVDESWILVPDNPNVYEISTSIDGDNFSGYKLLTTGSIVAMSVKLRITMTGVTRPGVLRSMTVNVTAQQNTLSYSDVIVPVGGLTLTFTPAFLNTPSVIVSPNGDTTLTVTKSNVTNASGTVQLLDSTGNDVGGSADIVVVGI